MLWSITDLENAEALLDSPGEFYVRQSGSNDGGGTLLYMPVAGETPATVGAVLPRMQELLVVDGASNVSIEGIEISHSDWMCGGEFKNETCDKQSAEQQEGALFSPFLGLSSLYSPPNKNKSNYHNHNNLEI